MTEYHVKSYRAGAIGWTGRGDYGHHLHRAFSDLGGVELVAIADPDADGRARTARDYGVTAVYSDYREMLAMESLDIVSIGPRWVEHREAMATACAEAGCHIFCDKPIAATLEEGDRMVAAADRNRVKLAVALQAVYLPGVPAARELIANGAIGPLQTLYGRGKQDRRGGGEDLAILGPHVLNLMRCFAGEPVSVWAHITEDGQPVAAGDGRETSEPVGLVSGDAVSAIFGFENGVTGIFESRADQPGKGAGYGLEIIGRDGRITLQSATAPVVTLFPNTAWPPADYHVKGTPTAPPPGDAREGNANAVRDLIAAIEEDRDPIASGRDAVAVLEMAHACYQSAITGTRVGFPLASRGHPLTRSRR